MCWRRTFELLIYFSIPQTAPNIEETKWRTVRRALIHFHISCRWPHQICLYFKCEFTHISNDKLWLKAYNRFSNRIFYENCSKFAEYSDRQWNMARTFWLQFEELFTWKKWETEWNGIGITTESRFNDVWKWERKTEMIWQQWHIMRNRQRQYWSSWSTERNIYVCLWVYLAECKKEIEEKSLSLLQEAPHAIPQFNWHTTNIMSIKAITDRSHFLNTNHQNENKQNEY